jgi:hypothetical protein
VSKIEGSSQLESIVGSRLVRVERQIFRSDFDYYDEACRDEESDGPIQFTAECGSTFYVAGNTERMSVEIFAGPMPRWGSTYFLREVTVNSFWAPRMGKRIASIYALVSDRQPASAAPFGIEFHLESAEPFTIEYLSDDDHLDQIRITGQCAEPFARRNCIVHSAA